MNAMRKRLESSADAGFTLVEMLIVIVVLGILTGIAAFSVSAFKGESQTACNAASTKVDSVATEAASASSSTTDSADTFRTAKDCT